MSVNTNSKSASATSRRNRVIKVAPMTSCQKIRPKCPCPVLTAILVSGWVIPQPAPKSISTGKTTINRKDWGLNWNAALETGGVLVSDDVRIYAEVQYAKQA